MRQKVTLILEVKAADAAEMSRTLSGVKSQFLALSRQPNVLDSVMCNATLKDGEKGIPEEERCAYPETWGDQDAYGEVVPD